MSKTKLNLELECVEKYLVIFERMKMFNKKMRNEGFKVGLEYKRTEEEYEALVPFGGVEVSREGKIKEFQMRNQFQETA